ncbi:hypothetical protein LWI29_003386 [Acer saccharum]|uniref:Uncharacterized protein n=1 Tax=Acer saccharum TaxID=4024 RepID=A0AA39RNC1_ACESA|nr:hypothetical protein LWI29_003386 [Acer saccharum]
MTRARCLPNDETTICILAIDNRSRQELPLSQDYFGGCVGTVNGMARAGELLEHNLGWAAWKLHQAVVGHTYKTVLEYIQHGSDVQCKTCLDGEFTEVQQVWN